MPLLLDGDQHDDWLGCESGIKMLLLLDGIQYDRRLHCETNQGGTPGWMDGTRWCCWMEARWRCWREEWCRILGGTVGLRNRWDGWNHDDAAGRKSGVGYGYGGRNCWVVVYTTEWEHGGFAGGQVDEWGRMEARWSCWMGTRKYFCYVLMIRAEVNYNLW